MNVVWNKQSSLGMHNPFPFTKQQISPHLSNPQVLWYSVLQWFLLLCPNNNKLQWCGFQKQIAERSKRYVSVSWLVSWVFTLACDVCKKFYFSWNWIPLQYEKTGNRNKGSFGTHLWLRNVIISSLFLVGFTTRDKSATTKSRKKKKKMNSLTKESWRCIWNFLWFA